MSEFYTKPSPFAKQARLEGAKAFPGEPELAGRFQHHLENCPQCRAGLRARATAGVEAEGREQSNV